MAFTKLGNDKTKEQKILVHVREFEDVKEAFTHPYPSSDLGCFKVGRLAAGICTYMFSEIRGKCFATHVRIQEEHVPGKADARQEWIATILHHSDK